MTVKRLFKIQENRSESDHLKVRFRSFAKWYGIFIIPSVFLAFNAALTFGIEEKKVPGLGLSGDVIWGWGPIILALSATFMFLISRTEPSVARNALGAAIGAYPIVWLMIAILWVIYWF